VCLIKFVGEIIEGTGKLLEVEASFGNLTRKLTRFIAPFMELSKVKFHFWGSGYLSFIYTEKDYIKLF